MLQINSLRLHSCVGGMRQWKPQQWNQTFDWLVALWTSSNKLLKTMNETVTRYRSSTKYLFLIFLFLFSVRTTYVNKTRTRRSRALVRLTSNNYSKLIFNRFIEQLALECAAQFGRYRQCWPVKDVALVVCQFLKIASGSGQLVAIEIVV